MKKVLTVIAVTAAVATIFVLPASAANEYAEKGATWVLDGLFWVILVLGISGTVMNGLKRNLTGALICLICTAIGCVFCGNPLVFKTVGASLLGILGL